MAGGPGRYTGANLQASFLAWCAVLGLAEETSQLPEASVSPIVRVGAEQNWPVDDGAVWFSNGSLAFVQSKETLPSSDSEDSELADVADQLVGQHLFGRGRLAGEQPLENDDRILIVVGARTGAPVRRDMAEALHRFATHPDEDSVISAAQGQGSLEAQIMRITRHVRRSLVARTGHADQHLTRAILRRTRVVPVAQDDLRGRARLILSLQILQDGQSALAAFEVLERLFSFAAEHRTSYDLTALRRHLAERFRLRAPRSVAVEAKDLAEQTRRAIAHERRLISARSGGFEVRRSVVTDVISAARVGSLAVTAAGGGGKSAVLLQAAEELQRLDERVVLLDLASGSHMTDVGGGADISRRLGTVLSEWGDDGRIGFLFIDGLDALRLGSAADRVVHLIRDLRSRGARWHIIAASREFDLETSRTVRGAFPVIAEQCIAAQHRDPRFENVAHIVVRDFDDAELQQITDSSAFLAAVFATASAELIKVLRNPFNLSVAAEIAGPTTDFSSIRDRIDLLDSWWQERIAVGERWQREDAVARVARCMVDARRLQIAVRELSPPPTALEQLTSDGVFRTHGTNSDELAFAHALIFDYAAYRTVVADVSQLTDLLSVDRDAFVFLLPSVRQRLDTVWRDDRPSFYAILAQLFGSGAQRYALLVLTCRIIAEEVERFADLHPLLARLDLPRERLVRYLVRALIRSRQRGEHHVQRARDAWIQFVLALTERLDTAQHDALLLLTEFTEHDPASRTDPRIVTAARRCMAFELVSSDIHQGRRNMALDAFFRTYDSDPDSARPLLNQVFDRERLSRYGPYELNNIGYHLKYITDIGALELAYSVIFSDVPMPSGNVPMGASSMLFGLQQDAAQPLQSARWALAKLYPSLAAASPPAAVRALAAALELRQARFRNGQVLMFDVDGMSVKFTVDHEDNPDDPRHVEDDWAKMQRALQLMLSETLQRADRRYADAVLLEASTRALPAAFLRTLLRVARHSASLTKSLVPVVSDPDVLSGHLLADAVRDFLTNAFELLEPVDRSRIESALADFAEQDVGERASWRDQRLDLYLRDIAAELLADPRLTAWQRDRQSANLDDRETALNLRGMYIGPAHMSASKLSDSAARRGASPEVIATIDEADALMPRQGEHIPDLTALAPMARRLWTLVGRSSDVVREDVLDVTAAVIQFALQRDALSIDETQEFAPVVLSAARGLHPEQRREDEEDEESEDSGTSWGWPNARILAAQGLGPMYKQTRNEELLSGIRLLSRDQVASVRMNAVEAARFVAHIDIAAAWSIAENAVNDRVLGVVHTAMSVAQSFSTLDVERYRRLELAMYDRLAVSASDTEFAKQIQRNVLYRAITGDDEAYGRVGTVIEEPWLHPELSHRFALYLANALRFVDGAMRTAARDALLAVLQRLRARLEALGTEAGLEGAHKFAISKLAPERQVEAQASARTFIAVGERIFYDSGAYAAGEGRDAGEDPDASFSEENYRLVEPLIRAVAQLPYSNLSYHLLRTLLVAIDHDPRSVLDLGVTVLGAGIANGLASEYLGQQEGAKFIMHYVERHRELLTGQREALSATMDAIDQFADAGWPEWIDVIFVIDSIYREE